MEKLSFNSDYMEGAHPAIIQKLAETNLEKTVGYGMDEYTASAKEKIKAAIGNPEADVYLLVGGTQTNATVIDALLQSYEGVLACDSGHIFVHEAGAIESTGHKVLTIKADDGKLRADAVDRFINDFNADPNHEHCVPVGACYISWPTEIGTIYTLKELQDLYAVCQKYGIYLYVDGARLGYGLAADTDVTIQNLAENCDAFYIGGTKVGALIGEAVVFKNKKICPHFFTIVKRHGALLAKGRILGIQFDTLFTDDLYFKISQDAIRLANRIEQAFVEKGYTVYYQSPTNQRFFLMENTQMEKLQEKANFEFWEKVDDTHTCVRFVTSWATIDAQVDALIEVIE